jgi:hypothetical protein
MASGRRAVYAAVVSPFRMRCALVALLLLAGSAVAEAKTKYLIECGWDEPNPAFMRAHMAQLEASPFDGCVYHVGGDMGGGQMGAFTWNAWGKKTFPASELAEDLANLQATRFGRFNRNFLRFSNSPGDIDWFDDYASVLSNLRLAASVARRGGTTGIFLDTENYKGKIFAYPAQRHRKTRSFAAYKAQARKRGGEVMRALEAGYPGLTVFLTVAGTHAAIQERGEPIAPDKGNYGLLPAFVDGMISAASVNAVIVDGMGAAFPVRVPADVDPYLEPHQWVRAASSNPAKYGRVVSRSFGIWLDFDSQKKPWHADGRGPNYRTPQNFGATVRRALELADDYVWIYSEQPRWWTAAGGRDRLPAPWVEAVRSARRGLTP